MAKLSLRAFKTLAPYLSRYRTRYVWGFICLITVDIAQMVIPQFIRRAVDLIASGSFQWGEVAAPAGAMVGVMGFISLGRFLWRYCIHGASRRIEKEMRDKLFGHLLTLSFDFYQSHKIGDLMSRATNDLNAVRESIGMGLVALVDGTVMAASILIIIFLQDPHTAALAVIPLPFITLIILFFGSAVGKKFRKAQETYSAMSDTVQETFAGIRVIKSFVKEWWFIKKFADTNDDYQAANMALVKLYGVFFPFISFLAGLTSLMVLLAGGIRVVEGLMSPGDLVALFRYFQMLIWPLMGAGFVVNMIQRGAASLGRVNEIMGAKPLIASPDAPQNPPPIEPENIIEIRDLSFAYPGGTPVLENLHLTIKQGAMVGIIGRTGSGKSTLIKTFTRMIEPPPGTVFVKGLAVGDWALPALRERFGVIPQDSYLFSDSIKNNIRYGLRSPAPSPEVSATSPKVSATSPNVSATSPEVLATSPKVSATSPEVSASSPKVSATSPEVSATSPNVSATSPEVPATSPNVSAPSPNVSATSPKVLAPSPEVLTTEAVDLAALTKAADLSALDRDLKTFAGGWDTVIGERGLTLSGGQKQRVAIARAVIGAPDILILDDALSAVDAETEKRILTALLAERQGKTTIIISHRVSALNHADKIAVLDAGRITEYGAPAELAAAGGFYAKMAALQQLDQQKEVF